jgi:hypothetical protein
MSDWIKCSNALPEPGDLVVVFSPPGKHDGPEDHRIEFDLIDPDSDGDRWFQHGEHYEHYCCVAKGGDVDWSGPSEKAPYTHWMAIPQIPTD